ncbi:MAG: hypothetical protein KIT45_04970 [Fimbriimonadia bacterium]|nr:hypothetical protein [Fimbriimonadia bacterium]
MKRFNSSDFSLIKIKRVMKAIPFFAILFLSCHSSYAQPISGSSNTTTPAVLGNNTGTGRGGSFFVNNSSSSAAALFGQTIGSGQGVFGLANSSIGFATGVWGQSAAQFGTGVYGVATHASGTNYGVYALTNSPSGYAGYFVGRSYFSMNVGIGTDKPSFMLDVQSPSTTTARFISTGTGGTALLAQSTATTGFGVGLTGRSEAASGTGIYAIASRPTGVNYGVYALTNSANGYAGYFLGRGYFSGNVGIGTTTPTTRLEVNGTVKASGFHLPTDASNGKVLVSDANGVGTWQDLSTGTVWFKNGSDIYYIGGKVGIGTNTPQVDLHITGTARIQVLEIDGADLAEKFPASEPLEPGMVVEIDPENPGQLRICRQAHSRGVAGVVAGANNFPSGIVLGKQTESEHGAPIALSGRVWVWCDATERAIEPQDLLTTSSTPGHAMAMEPNQFKHGTVLGKAMTRLEKGQKGMVLVLVNLQ